MNYSETVRWEKEIDNRLYREEGQNFLSLNEMLVTLRSEIERYVSAYQLDIMYDVMGLTIADMTVDKATYYLMLRECGTWLIPKEEVEERLDDLKQRYPQWIIFRLDLDKTRTDEFFRFIYPWNAKVVGWKSLDEEV